MIAETSSGAGDGGSIKLVNGIGTANGRGIEQVVFDDGTVWSQADMRAMVLTAAATSGDDTITGFENDDIIQGGSGNDTLDGKGGSDTYLYARGDGHDSINEDPSYNSAIVDKLVLSGVDPSAISFTRSGEAVTLVIAETSSGAGNGGSIKLVNGIETVNGRGIEQVVFDDGTVWSQADMRAMVLASMTNGGDDIIIGTSNNDIIQGGSGNDTLDGKGGSDTYLYARGDGHDSINEDPSYNSAIVDKLVLSGVDPSAISFTRSGEAVTLVIAETSSGAATAVPSSSSTASAPPTVEASSRSSSTMARSGPRPTCAPWS